MRASQLCSPAYGNLRAARQSAVGIRQSVKKENRLPTADSRHSHRELDPLRQRKSIGIVDGGGLTAHVGLPGIGAGFPPAAGFLLATERAADLRAARSDVHVCDTAVRARRRQEALRLLHILRE